MMKQNLTNTILLVMLAFASVTTVSAQRLQQTMGRGVVAVKMVPMPRLLGVDSRRNPKMRSTTCM